MPNVGDRYAGYTGPVAGSLYVFKSGDGHGAPLLVAREIANIAAPWAEGQVCANPE
jgi:hypothetical protein